MPARRSGRYRSRAWLYASESEPTTPPSLDYFEHELRRTRRRKRVHRRGHGGSLKLLTRMPLDILFDIFGHLHPLDVLHLARTSQRLREILMSRSSISVWKSAFLNVQGLPFCPSDLTEPQYANLAFDEHCHFCLAPNVQDVFWTCRVRCCKKCVGKYFVPESVLEQQYPDILPAGVRKREAIFPYIIYPKPQRNKPGRVLYYLPVAEMYFRELGKIASSDSEIAVTQWSKEKRIEQAQRLTHAALCESWSIHWVYRRSREFNLVIILFLFSFLLFLWRDKLWYGRL